MSESKLSLKPGATIAGVRVESRSPSTAGERWRCLCVCGDRFTQRAEVLLDKEARGVTTTCATCKAPARARTEPIRPAVVRLSTAHLKLRPVPAEHAEKAPVRVMSRAIEGADCCHVTADKATG